MGKLHETPSQTAGPYIHIGLAPRVAGFTQFPEEPGAGIAAPECPGEHIRIEGRVLDGAGDPMPDAVIELWQADADGAYGAREGFSGWGRVVPDLETGVFSFETVKPGPVPGRGNALQAPHLNLWLVARGVNIGLATRLYFADEAEANAADPVLEMVPPERRATLIALRGGSQPVYCFDIHLQGASETVFFDT